MNLQSHSALTTPWDRLGIRPGAVLRAYGMRRSGNHAIADWLLRNAPTGHSVFLNNCVPRKNPLGHFRSIEIDGRQVAPRKALRNLPAITAAAEDGAVLLISYEDTSPADTGRERPISGDFDEGAIDAELIFYRSFLNWSASLLKKIQPNPAFTLSKRAAIILRSIDRYVGILSLVQARDKPGLVPVCYDDWLNSETYRGELLARLGFPVRDNSRGKVQSYGGGSSFQKDAVSPEELATDRRWQQMAEDPEYLAILNLAARDTALTDRLARLFPQDAERLASLSCTVRGLT